MIMPGDRFSNLVAVEEITSEQAGQPGDGAWCWTRCDCGGRRLLRSRHLRKGSYKNCGRKSCEYVQAARPARFTLVCTRELLAAVDAHAARLSMGGVPVGRREAALALLGLGLQAAKLLNQPLPDEATA